MEVLLGANKMNNLEKSSEKSDRKLGDEWKDWDGSNTIDSSAGKRLFFALSGGVLLLLSGACFFGWYLIAPRLAQWHYRLPAILLGLVIIFLAMQVLLLGVVALALLFHTPLPRWLSTTAQIVLASVEGAVSSLGTMLTINSDRIAHSFVLIHNALIRSNNHPILPNKILILLPRCLTKEQLQQANTLSKEYGVNIAVVAGGELARQRIKEHQPKAVIGVACERDLLSGILDVHGKLCILGIPNTRPYGPCKDTLIDLQELRKAIEFYINPVARA